MEFIFTIKDEIDVVGARGGGEHFLWNVDAAIVVDRRCSLKL